VATRARGDLCSPCLVLALTARSLHCSGSVRLQSYFARPDETVSMPGLDPYLPLLTRSSALGLIPCGTTHWFGRPC